MTLSNEDLIKKFKRGATSGKSSRMEIQELRKDGEFRGTILVGYGWAVYGHRTPNGNKVTVFSDWHGYSNTTSHHINLLEQYSNNKIEGIKPTSDYHRGNRDPYRYIKEWDNFPFDTRLEREVYEATH